MTTPERKSDEMTPGCRVYHSRQELTEKVVTGERGGRRSNKIPSPILNQLLAIPGIVGAEVHVYHVAIYRSPMFEWKEIEPRVWELLDCFNLGVGNLLFEAAPDDCVPVEMGQGFRLIFQQEGSPNLICAVLEHQGHIVWKDGPIDHKNFTREQHLERVRMLLANAGLPDGVKL